MVVTMMGVNFYFFNFAIMLLKAEFTVPKRSPVPNKVYCPTRKSEIWSRGQSGHKRFWSSQCRLGG